VAYVDSYSRITSGTIPAEVWDEVWFSLASWKGYLQSVPGFRGLRFAARALNDGNVSFYLTTSWSYPEQLEEWHGSPAAGDKLLTKFGVEIKDLQSDTYEDLS